MGINVAASAEKITITRLPGLCIFPATLIPKLTTKENILLFKLYLYTVQCSGIMFREYFLIR